MQNAVEAASVEWRDGVPVSTRFDDPYFSLQNGLAETRHVFLGGNDLPARYRDGFHIAELGFGTGLNLLAAWQAWDSAGRFTYTSFEAFPMTVENMAQSLKTWPEMAPLAEVLLNAGGRSFSNDILDFHLIEGDARDTLPKWSGKADAWFLDGFSPSKNPELWSPPLMEQVAKHTAASGSFATYSAAGHVRRSLEAAGFAVERREGFGHKRHMCCGILR